MGRGQPRSLGPGTYEVPKTVTYSFAVQQPTGEHSFPARRPGEGDLPRGQSLPVGPDYEPRRSLPVKGQLAKAGHASRAFCATASK